MDFLDSFSSATRRKRLEADAIVLLQPRLEMRDLLATLIARGGSGASDALWRLEVLLPDVAQPCAFLWLAIGARTMLRLEQKKRSALSSLERVKSIWFSGK